VVSDDFGNEKKKSCSRVNSTDCGVCAGSFIGQDKTYGNRKDTRPLPCFVCNL
jgi:hypothetical protein